MSTVQKNFVKVVRAVEFILGISNSGSASRASATSWQRGVASASSSTNGLFNDEVKAVLKEAVPIFAKVAIELAVPAIFDLGIASFSLDNRRQPLMTKYVPH